MGSENGHLLEQNRLWSRWVWLLDGSYPFLACFKGKVSSLPPSVSFLGLVERETKRKPLPPCPLRHLGQFLSSSAGPRSRTVKVCNSLSSVSLETLMSTTKTIGISNLPMCIEDIYKFGLWHMLLKMVDSTRSSSLQLHCHCSNVLNASHLLPQGRLNMSHTFVCARHGKGQTQRCTAFHRPNIELNCDAML